MVHLVLLHQKEGKKPLHSRKIKTLYQKILFAPKGRPKPPEVYAILRPHSRNFFLHQKTGKNSRKSSKFKQIQEKLIKIFGKFWPNKNIFTSNSQDLYRPLCSGGLACVFASEINLLLLVLPPSYFQSKLETPAFVWFSSTTFQDRILDRIDSRLNFWHNNSLVKFNLPTYLTY